MNRKREELEIRMVDMLDAGYSKAEEEQLLEDLRQSPELLAQWNAVRTGWQPEIRAVQHAFPKTEPAAEELDSVRDAITLRQKLSDKKDAGIVTELLQWFPRYAAAAALMLIFLAGYFSLSFSAHEPTEQQISEWIYLFGEEDELETTEFLVQEFPFTLQRSEE